LSKPLIRIKLPTKPAVLKTIPTRRNVKTISVAKIEANRCNAQLSTGPRTPEGKKVVSRNAISHGIFSQDVVLMGGDGGEERGEFEALRQELYQEFQPQPFLEESLIEELASAMWRRARLRRHENGEIQKRLANARETERHRQEETVRRANWDYSDTRIRMERSSAGLREFQRCLDWLSNAVHHGLEAGNVLYSTKKPLESSRTFIVARMRTLIRPVIMPAVTTLRLRCHRLC
jgi:hypothetical protein